VGAVSIAPAASIGELHLVRVMTPMVGDERLRQLIQDGYTVEIFSASSLLPR